MSNSYRAFGLKFWTEFILKSLPNLNCQVKKFINCKLFVNHIPATFDATKG